MPYKYDFFISYAHKDNEPNGFVDEFVKRLRDSKEHQQMFGGKVEVFFDKTDIHNMSDWDNRIRSSLASSRFFIVLLSPNYFQSEYCAREFEWWMQHEMHRRVLGEGTAPMIIVKVEGIHDFKLETIPAIPPELQARFPNWLKQLRPIQADSRFDLHNLEIEKIDDVLKTLREEVKDKVQKQDAAGNSPNNALYPKYNANFVGRRENLRSMRKILTESPEREKILALTGLGGFGKTELALTYGHAFAWDYELGRVFAKCENKTSLTEVLLTSGIAEMHGWELPKGTDEQQITFLFNRLKAKQNAILEKNKKNGLPETQGARLLLILDNVNKLEIISKGELNKLPDLFHVVITTRENTNDIPYIHTETVERLSEDESVELLSNLRTFDTPEDVKAAREIAKLLAGFTLVVELTGAYLARNPRVSYQKQYERLFNNHAETFRLMASKTGDLTSHAAETVSAVMESTLAALTPNARKALEFAAQMAPDAVALGWLPELCELDEDDGFEVLDELTGYGLLTPLEDEPNVARIHRLVADEIKQQTPEENRKKINTKIREKCKVLLQKDVSFWCTKENSWNITPVSAFCSLIADHRTVGVSEAEIDMDITPMLCTSGDILNALGKIKETRDMYQCAFKISKECAKKYPLQPYFRWILGTMYDRLGDLENTIGNTKAARVRFKKALEIHKQLAKSMPENIQAKRDLSFSYNRLGNLEDAAGNTPAARSWYEKMLENSLQLAKALPENIEVQWDLSVSYNKLGNLENASRNFSAARKWYEKALKIRKRQAEAMPENVQVQRNLIVSYERLGDWERATGNVTSAREWYVKALEIDKWLTEVMPENVQVKRGLGVSYSKLGDLENAIGNAIAARDWYGKALKIENWLAEAVPENVEIQRDLSLSYERLGDMEKAAGNVLVARKLYEKSFEIFQRLAEAMRENVNAQRDLGVSYDRLGDLEYDAGNVPAAREWYEKALEISKWLADALPENVEIQQNLSVLYGHLGDLEKTTNNVPAARDLYEKALEIRKRLAEAMPENVEAQRDLCECYKDLTDLEITVKDAKAAKDWGEKALKILEPLVQKMPDDVGSLQCLGKTYRCLGDSEKALGNLSVAREWYGKSLAIRQRLADKIPHHVEIQKDLAEVKERLAQEQN